MADVLGFNIPVPNVGFGGIANTITIAIFVFVIAVILCFIIWMVYMARVYNRKIIVFENISGQGYQPTYRDKARLMKVGDGGEELLFLRRKKAYRTAYGKKMGKNTYWFAVGQDGYWYNVVLGDLDAKMGMLDIEPIDRDMRYMHVAVRRNIQERYRKLGIMDKYGSYIMNGVFLLIMIIGIWLLIDKMGDTASSVNTAVKTAKEIMDVNQKILSSLDNICSNAGVIRS